MIFAPVLGSHVLTFAHAGGELVADFEPAKIHMSPDTGRVYHPASEQYGGIGLVRSKLAIEFSSSFEFERGEEESPTHFTWNSTRYQLNSEWLKNIRLAANRKNL